LPNLIRNIDIENEERNKMVEIFVKEMNQELYNNQYSVIIKFLIIRLKMKSKNQKIFLKILWIRLIKLVKNLILNY